VDNLSQEAAPQKFILTAIRFTNKNNAKMKEALGHTIFITLITGFRKGYTELCSMDASYSQYRSVISVAWFLSILRVQIVGPLRSGK
jgi:hypothetical protein